MEFLLYLIVIYLFNVVQLFLFLILNLRPVNEHLGNLSNRLFSSCNISQSTCCFIGHVFYVSQVLEQPSMPCIPFAHSHILDLRNIFSVKQHLFVQLLLVAFLTRRIVNTYVRRFTVYGCNVSGCFLNQGSLCYHHLLHW